MDGNNYQDNTSNVVYQPSGNGGDNKANGKQIAGLVCGILGICSSCCYGLPGIILGIAGLICSVLGNKENKNGVGTAGLVCSVIGIVLGVIMLIYYIAVIGTIMSSPDFWEMFEYYSY